MSILILLLRINIYLDHCCLLYTSDAADERSSVDLGGRRIIKKKKTQDLGRDDNYQKNTNKEIKYEVYN